MQKRIATIVFAAWMSAQARGGSAIITLVSPPPGGEGSSALQTGSAFADGAAAMYYNPAALPELGRGTGSQFHFTHSRQDLLPMLQLPDLKQDFEGLSGVLPDPKRGTDLGIGPPRQFLYGSLAIGSLAIRSASHHL